MPFRFTNKNKKYRLVKLVKQLGPVCLGCCLPVSGDVRCDGCKWPVFEKDFCVYLFFLHLKVSFLTLRGRGDNYFLGVQFELPRPWYPALSIRMLNGSILFQSLTFHSRGHSCPTFINTANLLFPFSITHLQRARVVCIGAAIFQAAKIVNTKTLTFLSRWPRLVPRFPASSLPARLTRGSCHYACSSSSPTLPASPAA